MSIKHEQHATEETSPSHNAVDDSSPTSQMDTDPAVARSAAATASALDAAAVTSVAATTAKRPDNTMHLLHGGTILGRLASAAP